MLTWALEWLNKLLEPITLGTLGLLWYTARLWGSTKRLAEGAEATAERQLRAYVQVSGAKAKVPIRDGVLEVALTLKNFGQTPAHHVTSWIGIAAFNAGQQPHFPSPGDDFGLARGPIGPGAPRDFTIPLAESMTAPRWQALENGDAAVYVWGEIRYADIFGKKRFTRFRLRMSGEGASDGRFSMCEEGNNTDDAIGQLEAGGR